MEDREHRKKERESLLAKVRALLAKTVENGATEAEAIAAAAKAAEIMEKHDLSMDELDVRESQTKQQEHAFDPVFRAHLTRVAMAISTLCETRFWNNGSGATATKGTFYGLAHDVEISGYLFDICEGAMRRDAERYHEEHLRYLAVAARPRRRDSFLGGMADRLSQRILEISWARKRSGGTALVPVKDAIIDLAMKEDGIELKSARIGIRDREPDSYRRGKEAGNRVALTAGVAGNGPDAALR